LGEPQAIARRGKGFRFRSDDEGSEIANHVSIFSMLRQKFMRLVSKFSLTILARQLAVAQKRHTLMEFETWILELQERQR
jgi:hypothetical protein